MSNSQHSQQKPRRCQLVLLHVTSFCLCKTRASGVDRVVMFRIGVSSVLMAHSFSFDAEKGDRSIVGDSPICQAHSGCQLLILRPCFTTFNTHLLTCIAATPVCVRLFLVPFTNLSGIPLTCAPLVTSLLGTSATLVRSSAQQLVIAYSHHCSTHFFLINLPLKNNILLQKTRK